MVGHVSTRKTLIPIGNGTFDKFLGGGFVNLSLNLIERRGPSSILLDAVWNKSLAATTLMSKNNLVFVNFDSTTDVQEERFLTSLPVPRRVKTDLLYKDIRGKSPTAKIKIAWRYSNISSSPSDGDILMEQIDFGLSMAKETDPDDRGSVAIINVRKNFTFENFFKDLDQEVSELKNPAKVVNIIIKDLLHPFSPLIDDTQQLCKFMYALRCFARTLDIGIILVSYDVDMCSEHSSIKQHLYNISDCVLSFYSFETGQNKLAGYKNSYGTIDYVKMPKINSFGLHFQRELSDWGYRLTRNNRYFVLDELSLPPCEDDDDDKATNKNASEVTAIEHKRMPLEQVGPLEDFREVAEDVLPKH